MRGSRMNGYIGEFKSSFLSCEKDTETIVKKLFVDSKNFEPGKYILTGSSQFKLKENPNYTKYLRENSHWYKLLTRNPNLFNQFVDEMKVSYKLRPIDKINNALSMVEMMQNLISTIK